MRGFSPHSSSHLHFEAIAQLETAEASAAFVSIGGNESATMCGDDRLPDCKADAHASFLRSEERLEDSAGIGNTDPSILYIDHDLLF